MGNNISFIYWKNISQNSKITLVERNEVLIDDAEIAQTSNTFFNKINTFNIERDESIVFDKGNEIVRIAQ